MKSYRKELWFETRSRREFINITPEVEGNLFLASRNVPGVHALDVAGLDPVSLVAADKVIMTVDAVKKIEEWLGGAMNAYTRFCFLLG